MLSQAFYFDTRIKPRQEKLKDGLIVQDRGNSVWTKTPSHRAISNGCLACKTGTWMCIYVGNKCNVACDYCSQGSNEEKNARIDNEQATRFMPIEDLRCLIRKQASMITGISYSGGEPLLYLPKIKEIATFVYTHYPKVYQWLYTNGVLINDEALRILAGLNIQEIRVHLGATEFSDEVIDKMKLAVKYIRHVNVETPSVPAAKEHLIKRGIIHLLQDIGVYQINLAELMIQCPLNNQYVGDAETYSFCSQAFTVTSPTYSREITYDIMEYAIKSDLDIIINDCSNQAKSWQQIMCKKNNIRIRC